MEKKIKTAEIINESGRRVLEIEAGEKVYQLRLTVGSQLNLKNKYKNEPLQIIIEAVQDTEKFIGIIDEALSWSGNENDENINGEQFYDFLVDNGVLGMNELAKILLKIASASGIFSRKQMETLQNAFSKIFDSIFEQFGADEIIEKLSDSNEVEKGRTFQKSETANA